MTFERQLGIIINLKKIRLLIKKIELFCLIRKANPYRRMQKALEQKVIMISMSIPGDSLFLIPREARSTIFQEEE